MRCGLESPLQWLRQISDFHCVVRCSAFVPHITYFSGYSSPTRQPCITHSLTHSQPRQPTVCQNACTEVRAHAKHNISSCRKSAKGKHDWEKKCSRNASCAQLRTRVISVSGVFSPPLAYHMAATQPKADDNDTTQEGFHTGASDQSEQTQHIHRIIENEEEE